MDGWMRGVNEWEREERRNEWIHGFVNGEGGMT